MKTEIEMYEQQKIEKQMKERTVYITEDGKKFYNIEEAVKHEQYLSVPRKEFKFEFIKNKNVKAFYLQNEEDVKKLGHNPHSGMFKTVVYPGWYIIDEEGWGWDTLVYVQSVEKAKEELMKAIENLD